jgi:hypothetical protein
VGHLSGTPPVPISIHPNPQTTHEHSTCHHYRITMETVDKKDHRENDNDNKDETEQQQGNDKGQMGMEQAQWGYVEQWQGDQDDSEGTETEEMMMKMRTEHDNHQGNKDRAKDEGQLSRPTTTITTITTAMNPCESQDGLWTITMRTTRATMTRMMRRTTRQSGP